MTIKSQILFFILIAVLAVFIFWKFILKDSNTIQISLKDGSIIFFGDSLVEGVGAAPGNDLPVLLSRQIGEEVINAGRSGDTTASALARLEQDVLSKKPRLVIILLGGNDFLRQISPQETFNNFSLMIDRIQQKDAGVLLLGVRGGILGDPFKERFERLAKENKISYIPNVLDGIIGSSDLMSDPIHPNDKGYAKIAERIAPVVKEIIK